MPRLVVLNGPPGSGKSTLAAALAQRTPLAFALDLDQLKHALGRWDEDPTASGLRARELALAAAAAQLRAGGDVIVGQYLARTAFLEQLEDLARASGADFLEILLEVDEETLARRLAARAADPERPEHAINAALTAPGDAALLIGSLQEVRAKRPGAVAVDARGEVAETAARIVSICSTRKNSDIAP